MWFKSFATGELIAFSAAANVATFVAALLLGAIADRFWRKAPPAPPATREEYLLAAVCVVLNTAVMIVGWLLFKAEIIRVDDAPSPLRWLVDAGVLLLVMDFAMYVTHRIAHHPLAFRLVHAIHHRYDNPRPLTLFVLHPLEVLGFGALWIAVLIPHAFSLGGILIYLALNTTYGTLGHTTGAFHLAHHAVPTSKFGFYTPIWDRLFRTYT